MLLSTIGFMVHGEGFSMDKQTAAGGQDKPSAARRNVLTGGAIGLAALAGSALGRTPSASAQTTTPSITDWLNITNYGASTSGTPSANTTAINTALADAYALPTGGVVYVPVGTFQINGPLFIPKGVTLRGAIPVAPNWSSATEAGSVLQAVPTWTPNTAFAQNSIIYMAGNTVTSGSTTYVGGSRMGVEDLWIDGSELLTSTDVIGIGAAYSAFNGIIRNVGLYRTPSDGIQFINIGGAQPDGWLLESIMIDRAGGNGVTLAAQDTLLIGVHVQNGNVYGTGDGFMLNDADNGRFIACRADSCNNGFTFPTGNGGTLIGCGTEGNTTYGLNVQNSSTTFGAPVRCSGCSFTYDGVSGIYVSGLNIVLLEQCNVLVGSGNTTPAVALTTAVQDGDEPLLVQAMGGLWNCTSTTAAGSVSLASTAPVSYSVHLIYGGPIGSSGASAPQIFQLNQL
jgi:hypothetical protein